MSISAVDANTTVELLRNAQRTLEYVEPKDELSDEAYASVSDEYPILRNDEALVEIEEYGWFDEDATKVELTIETDNGVEFEYVVDVTGEQPKILKAGMVIGAASVAIPEPASSVTGGAVLGIVVGATLVLDIISETTPGSAKEVAEVSLGSGMYVGGEPIGTWETPVGLEITLPAGAVYETIGDHRRGFGWEHIEQTGVTQETTKEIIKNLRK